MKKMLVTIEELQEEYDSVPLWGGGGRGSQVCM